MDGGPEVDRRAERAKVLADLGFSLGLAAAALILVVSPLLFNWGLTARTISFVLALLVAAFGVFGLLNDLAHLAGRPSLREFGTSSGLVTLAFIPVVFRNGYGIDGVLGGLLIAVALAIILFAVISMGVGLGNLAAERARVETRPAAPKHSSSPSPELPASPPVPRRDSRPLSRDTKLTIVVTLFVGVLTAIATLIAPLLE